MPCVPLGYRKKFALPGFLALAALTFWGYPARAQRPSGTLRVAAAADLQPVLPQLTGAFEKETGLRVSASFGSSATLTQQIENGAPDDVFLSADCSHPQTLAQEDLASTPLPYATGELVLWAKNDSPLQPLSLQKLKSPLLQHLAVANDRHAPYGAAATAEISALGLQAALANKLVVGENILQTAQFADSGSAQAGLISLTIASSPHFTQTGSFVRLPPRYPPLRQCGAALTHAQNPAAATMFLRWLTSPQVQSKLPALGLRPAIR